MLEVCEVVMMVKGSLGSPTLTRRECTKEEGHARVMYLPGMRKHTGLYPFVYEGRITKRPFRIGPSIVGHHRGKGESKRRLINSVYASEAGAMF
jgi:hypothetical protein